jgi:hypothetical protein
MNRKKASVLPLNNKFKGGKWMKKSFFIYIMLVFILILIPIAFIGMYTVNKELRYTILDAIFDGPDILKHSALLYLGKTNRIHTEHAHPYNLLSFTVINYNQAGVDKKATLGLINLFLNRGIDINAYNSKGTTALHEAVLLNKIELIQFLVERGADLHKPILDTGESRVNALTPLQFAEWLQQHSSERGDWGDSIIILRRYLPASS